MINHSSIEILNQVCWYSRGKETCRKGKMESKRMLRERGRNNVSTNRRS